MSIQAGSLGNVFIRATRPPQTWLIPRDPTPYDTQGYYLLDEWLNTVTDTPWILVSLKGNNMSRGEVALWVQMGGSGGIVISVVGGNNITITGTATNPIVNVSGTTNHSVQLGAANGALNSLANGTTGQLLTAQTGADPIWASSGGFAQSFITNPATGTAIPASGVLTFAGTGGITVSAAGSTVTINGPSSFITWVDVTAATQAMAINTGYTANSSSLITFTLPATAAYGTELYVVGKGTGLWTIVQNASQIIHFGSVNTTVTTGSLSSTLQYDVVGLVCSVANTEWTVIQSIGDITYV